MKPAIEIKGLSKKYRKGSNASYLTLRDKLAGIYRAKNTTKLASDEFWALKDIDLKIMPGEVVGIIGHNGAGKSTLLKVLSRITHPTEGEITIRGRVGSLLEIGTGFHPELTGRENIFLNGAVLGMTRKEIISRFSEIVEFSGIKDFLDTPVKHYSSGMYTRLGFSVAAHLDSEILLIDEVLAVGDIEFQKRCFDKMHSLATNEKRTVILVSHNISAIRNLCQKAILFDKGRLILAGSSEKVTEKYLSNSHNHTSSTLNISQREGSAELMFTNVAVSNIEGGSVKKGDSIIFNLEITNKLKVKRTCRMALSIRTREDNPLISCDTMITGELITIPAKNKVNVICRLENPQLNPGKYLINIAIFRAEQPLDWLKSAYEFEVLPALYMNHIVDVPFPMFCNFSWRIKDES